MEYSRTGGPAPVRPLDPLCPSVPCLSRRPSVLAASGAVPVGRHGTKRAARQCWARPHSTTPRRRIGATGQELASVWGGLVIRVLAGLEGHSSGFLGEPMRGGNPSPCVAPERFHGGFRAINARGSPCWNLRAATPASDARQPGPKNRSGTGGGRRRSGRCAPPAAPAATRSSGRGAG